MTAFSPSSVGTATCHPLAGACRWWVRGEQPGIRTVPETEALVLSLGCSAWGAVRVPHGAWPSSALTLSASVQCSPSRAPSCISGADPHRLFPGSHGSCGRRRAHRAAGGGRGRRCTPLAQARPCLSVLTSRGARLLPASCARAQAWTPLAPSGAPPAGLRGLVRACAPRPGGELPAADTRGARGRGSRGRSGRGLYQTWLWLWV